VRERSRERASERATESDIHMCVVACYISRSLFALVGLFLYELVSFCIGNIGRSLFTLGLCVCVCVCVFAYMHTCVYTCANGLRRAVPGPVYRRLACTLAPPAAISSHTHKHTHTHTHTHTHDADSGDGLTRVCHD